MNIRSLLVVVLVLLGLGVKAQWSIEKNGQRINVLTTAVPFLLIGPDARAGGMGDGGVASSPDANSMHWNAAKYAQSVEKQGFAISYTPWLRKLVNDINMAYVSYFNRINRMNAVAFSLRYFSLGEIQFTDDQGTPIGIYKPNEFAVDGAYSRLLSDNFSLAIAGRFIYSNLTSGQNVGGIDTKAGISVAADISMYWQKDVNWFKTIDAQFAWGLNISNIGSKISYTSSNIQKDFIPTNFRFGPRLTLFIDDYNKISFQADINKLLVPTPPIYYSEGDTMPNGTISGGGTEPDNIKSGKNPDVPPITGMIQSWYDAPGGFSEEISEFNFAIGAEYWYNDIFSIRAGYFWEDKYKGNRKYVTLGVGLRYNVFGLDFSYLIPTTGIENPLQNTLRFTLLFNFGAANTTKGTTPTG
jgi:hypothetical protein